MSQFSYNPFNPHMGPGYTFDPSTMTNKITKCFPCPIPSFPVSQQQFICDQLQDPIAKKSHCLFQKDSYFQSDLPEEKKWLKLYHPPKLSFHHKPSLTTVGNSVVENLSRVAFFDLDDTLIPTDWVRRAFVSVRGKSSLHYSSPITVNSNHLRDTAIIPTNIQSTVAHSDSGVDSVTLVEALSHSQQQLVRQELKRLTGEDFEDRAVKLIEDACKSFGVVVIVTNARSSAWLEVVSQLFPKFKQQLRRLSIPIIRAANVPSQNLFQNATEYFQYWADLKKIQFSRIINTTLSIIYHLKQFHTLDMSLINCEKLESFMTTSIPMNPSSNTNNNHSSYIVNTLNQSSVSNNHNISQYTQEQIHHHNHHSLASTPLAFQHWLNNPYQTLNSEEFNDAIKFESRIIKGCLLSPKAHEDESLALELILLKTDNENIPLTTDMLIRLISHQIRRFILLHVSQCRPAVAKLPYPPHTILSVPSEISSLQSVYTKWDTVESAHHSNMSQIEKVPIEILCVGDSEFELCAARELAEAHPLWVWSCGLVKCRSGLSPDNFYQQLDYIEHAMNFIIHCNNENRIENSGVQSFGSTVIAEYTTQRKGFKTAWLGYNLVLREQFIKMNTLNTLHLNPYHSFLNAKTLPFENKYNLPLPPHHHTTTTTTTTTFSLSNDQRIDQTISNLPKMTSQPQELNYVNQSQQNSITKQHYLYNIQQNNSTTNSHDDASKYLDYLQNTNNPYFQSYPIESSYRLKPNSMNKPRRRNSDQIDQYYLRRLHHNDDHISSFQQSHPDKFHPLGTELDILVGQYSTGLPKKNHPVSSNRIPSIDYKTSYMKDHHPLCHSENLNNNMIHNLESCDSVLSETNITESKQLTGVPKTQHNVISSPPTFIQHTSLYPSIYHTPYNQKNTPRTSQQIQRPPAQLDLNYVSDNMSSQNASIYCSPLHLIDNDVLVKPKTDLLDPIHTSILPALQPPLTVSSHSPILDPITHTSDEDELSKKKQGNMFEKSINETETKPTILYDPIYQTIHHTSYDNTNTYQMKS